MCIGRIACGAEFLLTLTLGNRLQALKHSASPTATWHVSTTSLAQLMNATTSDQLITTTASAQFSLQLTTLRAEPAVYREQEPWVGSYVYVDCAKCAGVWISYLVTKPFSNCSGKRPETRGWTSRAHGQDHGQKSCKRPCRRSVLCRLQHGAVLLFTLHGAFQHGRFECVRSIRHDECSGEGTLGEQCVERALGEKAGIVPLQLGPEHTFSSKRGTLGLVHTQAVSQGFHDGI